MSISKAISVTIMVATAQPAFARGLFDSPAIDDVALAGERGTFRPSGLLAMNQVKRLQDDTSRMDFGLTGSVGSIVMDNWWATDGALLIDAGRMPQK